MSSNDTPIIIIPIVIRTLSQYLLPFLILIGNISWLLSLVIFLQKSMRKNPSGLYFLSFTVCNIIFINTMISAAMLYYGFDIDPSSSSLLLCPLYFYIGFVTGIVSTSYLILASIDRFIITSSNFNIRRFSTCSMAIKFIFGITIFWLLVHIHVFFFTIEDTKDNHKFYCILQPGTYTLILIWYELVVFGSLTPILMICFGLRTIANVRRVLVSPMSPLYYIDRQLIIIMLSQCFSYAIFRLPVPIYLIYNYMTESLMMDIQYQTSNLFFFYISLICFYIPYCTFFFVNLISRSFRAEVKRVAKYFIRRHINKNQQQIRKVNKRRHNHVHPINVIQRRGAVEMTVK